jgi:hypothetical protein
VDRVEFATNLLPTAAWQPVATFSNTIAADFAGFTNAWQPLALRLDGLPSTNTPAGFLRLRRRLLAW